MDAITITRANLAAALLAWEAEHRSGHCRSHEETAALPMDQVAREGADFLWFLLSHSKAAA